MTFFAVKHEVSVGRGEQYTLKTTTVSGLTPGTMRARHPSDAVARRARFGIRAHSRHTIRMQRGIGARGACPRTCAGPMMPLQVQGDGHDALETSVELKEGALAINGAAPMPFAAVQVPPPPRRNRTAVLTRCCTLEASAGAAVCGGAEAVTVTVGGVSTLQPGSPGAAPATATPAALSVLEAEVVGSATPTPIPPRDVRVAEWERTSDFGRARADAAEVDAARATESWASAMPKAIPTPEELPEAQTPRRAPSPVPGPTGGRASAASSASAAPDESFGVQSLRETPSPGAPTAAAAPPASPKVQTLRKTPSRVSLVARYGLAVQVSGARVVDEGKKHVVYQVVCTSKAPFGEPGHGSRWTVERRYSQFEKLVLLLQRDFPLFLEATGPMPVSTVAAAPACCCRWLTGSPG